MKNYTIVLFISILFFANCKEKYDEQLASSLQRKDYVSVKVSDLEISKELIPIFAIGRISSDVETKLSYKTGGYISSLFAREGDYVRKGKLLGRLRTEEIDAQVLKAVRALEKGNRDLERVTAMYADSVATLENVQDLTTLVEISQADLNIAKFNQQYSKIVSPVSGRVLHRLAEPNELVSPGQPIFVIASSERQSYIMKIHVSDKDISMMTYGTKAVLSFDAFPSEEFSAKVNRISESADPVTGTFEIELTLNSNKQRLRNGMIGRATLYPDSRRRYVKVPMVSISEGAEDEVTIYVPDSSNTQALERRVKVARFSDDFVWVERRLINDSRVITMGSAYLKEGQKIRIQE